MRGSSALPLDSKSFITFCSNETASAARPAVSYAAARLSRRLIVTPASGPRFVSYFFAIVSSRSNGSLEEPNRRQALASQ